MLQQCCIILQQYCIVTLLQRVLVDTPLRCSNVACDITLQCCRNITTILILISHILVPATLLQYCIAKVAGMLQQCYWECCSNVSFSLYLNIAVMLTCNILAMLLNATVPYNCSLKKVHEYSIHWNFYKMLSILWPCVERLSPPSSGKWFQYGPRKASNKIGHHTRYPTLHSHLIVKGSVCFL